MENSGWHWAGAELTVAFRFNPHNSGNIWGCLGRYKRRLGFYVVVGWVSKFFGDDWVQVWRGLGALCVTESNLGRGLVAAVFLWATEVSFSFSFFNQVLSGRIVSTLVVRLSFVRISRLWRFFTFNTFIVWRDCVVYKKWPYWLFLKLNHVGQLFFRGCACCSWNRACECGDCWWQMKWFQSCVWRRIFFDFSRGIKLNNLATVQIVPDLRSRSKCIVVGGHPFHGHQLISWTTSTTKGSKRS